MNYLLYAVKLMLYRKMFKLTQPQVSRKVGMPLKSYQHVEEGQNEPMSGTMAKIGKGTGLSFEPEDFTVRVDARVVDILLGRVSIKEVARR